MKCPKCGSDMRIASMLSVTATNELKEITYQCDKCLEEGKFVFEKVYPTKQEQYKFRLDEVLSKFKVPTHGMYIKEFSEGCSIDYYTESGIFYWTTNSDEFVISLETVESLIKDLEVE